MSKLITRIKLNKENKVAVYAGRTNVHTFELHTKATKKSMTNLLKEVDELIEAAENNGHDGADLVTITDIVDGYQDEADEKYGFESEDEDVEADEEAGEDGKMQVQQKYRDRYKKTDGTCGDDMAYAMRDATQVVQDGKEVCSPDELRVIAKKNGLVERYDDNWSSHNTGHARMILTNALRGKLKRGEKVVVGSRTWKENAAAKKRFQAQLDARKDRLAKLRKSKPKSKGKKK